jgi:hypothetical protein
MKKIIAITILSLISQFAISQNNYFKVLTSPCKDGVWATVETNNGNIIMCTAVSTGEFLKKEYINFLKINLAGDTIASRKIKMPNDYYDFNKILKLDNNLFMAVGSSFYFGLNNFISIHNKIMIYTFNSDLDSISFNEITMEDNSIEYLSMRDAIVNSNNHIITLCEDMSTQKIMLLEASLSGDSIRTSRLEPTYSAKIYSIAQKSDSSGYLITTDGDYNHLNHGYISHIITIDNNLNFVAIDSLPGECAYFSQVRKFNSSILVGGRAKRQWVSYPPPIPPPSPYLTEEYCIEKLNSTFQATKQVYLSHVYIDHQGLGDDTISYPSLDQNFDFIDTNNIYSCHYREYPSAVYPGTHNYFVISKFNSNLDTKWQYYFGYDAFYAPTRIIATNDGGCFVSGNRYDSQTQYQEFDVFYLKLDSTGIFVSTNDPKIAVNSAILFPNPGIDKITLESGPQVIGATFMLFTMQGMKVMEQRINSSRQTMDIFNHQSGTYIWEIVKNEKTVDSGKWIKQP